MRKEFIVLLLVVVILGLGSCLYEKKKSEVAGVSFPYNHNGIIYKKLNKTEVIVVGYKGHIEDINILRKINNFSVTSIGKWAFYNCSSLTSVSIPNSVILIGYSAFEECSNLISVSIPSSVISIGENAFYDCSSLTSVSIPNSVTSIGDYTFYNCSSLTNVSIPDSVTSIGYSAFEECSNLINVSIPSSVTSIGEYAFYNCSNLTSVTILALTAPILKRHVFGNVSNCVLHIKARASGYDINPWTDTSIFLSIVRDL